MVIDDDVVGVGNPAGSASFTAYKSFTSTQLINLRNGGENSSEVPGGSLYIDTKTGSVSIEANLNVNGGSDAEGGTIAISSGENVSISGNLLLNGGTEGGGSLEIDADRDVLVGGDIDAATASSDSVGGEIYIQAQRDIVFTAPGSFNQTVIDTKGHSANGLPGSGGSQVFTAGRTLSVGSHVVLKSMGPVGEGDGGTIELHACTLTVAANATVEVDGPYGGTIELSGLHVLEVDEGATVDASGSKEDGDILLLTRNFVRCEAGSHNACQVNADCDICTSGTCEPPRVCSNSPATQCTVDSDCTSGCGSGTCMEGACTNVPEMTCDVDSECENIGCQSDDCLNALQVGDESQFDPAAEKQESPRLSACL
jgi:hypothetical protein